MSNILAEIVGYKHIEVQHRKKLFSVESLKAAAATLPKCRNFYKTVTKSNPRGINVIAEIKKASPSAGLIRQDFNPVQIARIYESCGADAISCLTDEKYFQGKLEYIRQIKDEVDIPVLRKDFIIDEYQIYESRAAGADAILLIGECLDSAKLLDFLILASELTLTSLIEVHSAETLMRIRSAMGFPQAGYSVIGINNRDLATMKVDINNAGRLSHLLNSDTKFVAESGIQNAGDIARLKSFGACAVLIGETLCKSPDIAAKFREIFG